MKALRPPYDSQTRHPGEIPFNYLAWTHIQGHLAMYQSPGILKLMEIAKTDSRGRQDSTYIPAETSQSLQTGNSLESYFTCLGLARQIATFKMSLHTGSIARSILS